MKHHSGRQTRQAHNPKDTGDNEVKKTLKALSGIMFKTYTIQKWPRLHNEYIDKAAGMGNDPKIKNVM